MRRRLGAWAGAAALVFGVAAGGLAVSTPSAEASAPVVVGSCGATIEGKPGAPLAISPSALLTPVTNLLRTLDPLHLVTPPVINAIKAMPNIPLGMVPSSTTTISGGQVSKAALPMVHDAIDQIPLIGPILSNLLGGLQTALTGGCSVIVKAVNVVSAPVQDGTGAIADTSEQAAKTIVGGGSGSGSSGGSTGGGGGSGAGGGNGTVTQMPHPNSPVVGGLGLGEVQMYDPNGLPYNFGRSPMAMYANLPYAQPGVFSPAPGSQYGSSVPGYSPQFGLLGGGGQPDGVEQAGHAEALAAPTGDRVALPVLLAVLALSGVTAALVRTWVLRRTIAS